MAPNATHAEYEASAGAWSRARDVIAGEDALKAAGARYLPRLDVQSDDEYDAYVARASFFNATARTAEGFAGLVFRRMPWVKVMGDGTTKQTNDTKGGVAAPSPQPSPLGRGSARSALGIAMGDFVNDVDLRGTPLVGYAKNVVSEVLEVGRAGTLMDWCAGGNGQGEERVYATLYRAEEILNWRVGRMNGRTVLTLVALAEKAERLNKDGDGDGETVDQIRILRLDGNDGKNGEDGTRCTVEIWQPKEKSKKKDKVEWQLVETRVPLRRGKALPLIPFVFHGPRHSLPEVDKLPLADIIAVNLDHYRLDAEYKHGMHFTALPTAWVSGFDKGSTLKIGSSTAWVTETPGATAGYLEFTGQGLTTFERAMDRDERLMAVLGSRMLEDQKRVGETAQAIELRQSGESSVLGNLARSVSDSLTQMLRWAHWWNSTEEMPEAVGPEKAVVELNTDFSTSGMGAAELTAVVKAWQSGAMSQETMHELFRKGEILPEGRSNEEEAALIARGVTTKHTEDTKEAKGEG